MTQVNRPTGNAALMFLRLFPLAPRTRISWTTPRVARCSASRAARRTAASLGGKRGFPGLRRDQVQHRQPARAARGNRDALLAGEVLARQRRGRRLDVLVAALRHDAAAMDAGAGTHVDQVVGGPDHVLVVLHHEHAVADVAQVPQGADQAVVVALVQADARFVQHVHHAGQPRPDLGSQADALRLAARQCLGAAVQAQVVQPHVVEEFQPEADLADHLLRDFGLGAAQFEPIEILEAFAQSGVADLVDGAGLPPSPILTCLASLRRRVPRQSGQGCRLR